MLNKDNIKTYPLTVSQFDNCVATLILSKKSRDLNHLGFYFTVKNNPDVDALRKSFNMLVKENDALRLRILFTAKGLRQYVSDYEYIDIPTIKLNSSHELEDEMNKYRRIDGYLFGKVLYRPIIFLYESSATLFICVHHMCFDGYSSSLMNKQLREYYEAFSKKQTIVEKDIKYTYIKHIEDELVYKKSKKHEIDKVFCKNQLNSLKNFKVLVGLINSKSPVKSHVVSIKNERYYKVVDFCKETQIPLSSFITSIASLAIGEHCNARCFNFFNIDHGRANFYQKQTMGCMVGLFLNVYNINDKDTIQSYLKDNYINYLDAMKHERISVFERIIYTLKTELKILRFHYYGIIFTVLDVNDKSDDGKYVYGSVKHNYQPNQFYNAISDNKVNEVYIKTFYQTSAIKQEELDTIDKRFNEIVDMVLENKDIKIRNLINIKK